MQALATSPRSALSTRHLLAYAAPYAAFTFANMPLSLWLGKFATDTLLMPAAALGTIVMIARVWDGVSDPVAGYYSDRTRSRLGRRRSWMLASILPGVLTLVALWSPPSGLEGTALVLWVGAAYVLWETASTIFIVPYTALGAELSDDYHERTRLFAWRHVVSVLGYGASLGVVYLLRTAAESGGEDARAMATLLAAVMGATLAACVIFSVRNLEERAEHQERGAVNLRRALRDVARNPHARVLLMVYAVETFGMGTIGFLTPYLLDDVLGQVGYLEIVLVCWVAPQFAFTPLWVGVARRIGKKRLWIAGMLLYGFGFSLNFLAPVVGVGALFGVVLLLGTAGGIGNILSPAMQADVIDWDELETGERKEGAYTAIWNMVRKSGFGVSAGLGGIALGMAGYDGAAEAQSERVKTTILLMASALPATAHLLAAAALARFRFNEAEHGAVRAELERRRADDA